MNRFLFPKSSRLYLRKEIDELVTTGKTMHFSPLKVFYRMVPAGDAPLKMALAVPKRSFKHAVERNRIKRQMREAFRLKSPPVAGFFKEKQKTIHLLFVYTSKVSPEYVTLESKIILILQRLQEMHERDSC